MSERFQSLTVDKNDASSEIKQNSFERLLLIMSKDTNSKTRSLTDLLYQFFLGILLGLILTLIPLSYISISTIELTFWHVVVLSIMVFFPGIFAAIFGNKFLSPLTKFLDSLPPLT